MDTSHRNVSLFKLVTESFFIHKLWFHFRKFSYNMFNFHFYLKLQIKYLKIEISKTQKSIPGEYIFTDFG